MQTLHNINKGGGEAREGEEPWGLECGREGEGGFRRGAWRVGKRTRERREEVSKMTQAIGMGRSGSGCVVLPRRPGEFVLWVCLCSSSHSISTKNISS